MKKASDTLPELPRHLPALDAFRGIAILGVILTHTCTNWPGLARSLQLIAERGGFGVDLFFLVSAFTLMHSVESERTRKGGVNWKKFYLRRFFRIAPRFFAAAVYYQWGNPFVGSDRWAPNGRTIWDYAALGLLFHGFVPSAIDIVPGGWSIGCEWFFYLLFGVLVSQVRSTLGFAIALVASIQIGFLTSVGIAAVLRPLELEGTRWTHWIQFCPIVRCSSFLLGLWAYRIATEVDLRGHRKHLIAVAVTWFACLAYRTLPLAAFPLWTISSFGFVSLLLVFHNVQKIPVYVRWLCGLGNISYSIYITHFAVMKYSTNLIARLQNTPPLVGAGCYFAVVLVGSVIVSLVTWRCIEQPGIAVGKALQVRLR